MREIGSQSPPLLPIWSSAIRSLSNDVERTFCRFSALLCLVGDSSIVSYGNSHPAFQSQLDKHLQLFTVTLKSLMTKLYVLPDELRIRIFFVGYV
jgi:hypothetical protein